MSEAKEPLIVDSVGAFDEPLPLGPVTLSFKGVLYLFAAILLAYSFYSRHTLPGYAAAAAAAAAGVTLAFYPSRSQRTENKLIYAASYYLRPHAAPGKAKPPKQTKPSKQAKPAKPAKPPAPPAAQPRPAAAQPRPATAKLQRPAASATAMAAAQKPAQPAPPQPAQPTATPQPPQPPQPAADDKWIKRLEKYMFMERGAYSLKMLRAEAAEAVRTPQYRRFAAEKPLLEVVRENVDPLAGYRGPEGDAQ